MNAAHWHLLLNHIPVLGSIFALCLLLPGALRKNYSLINASLITVVVVAIFAVIANLSGEEAEEIVESINAIDKNALEVHEEFSESALWVSIAGGVIALATLLYMAFTRRLNIMLIYLNIIALCVIVFLMARTAYTGGEIRHSEIHLQAE